MNPSLVTVANSFYLVAAVVGAPSLVATLLYAVFRLRLWATPLPAASSLDGVKNPDAILLVIGGMARSIGAVAGAIGSLGQVVFGIIAAVAVAGLIFSVAAFFTGRGLHAHQDWARTLGGVLMGGLLLVSLLSLVALRGPLFLLALGLFAASGYALLGLWRGFAA